MPARAASFSKSIYVVNGIRYWTGLGVYRLRESRETHLPVVAQGTIDEQSNVRHLQLRELGVELDRGRHFV